CTGGIAFTGCRPPTERNLIPGILLFIELTDGESIVADENYIRQSILDPTSQVVAGFPPAMPVQDLDDAQIQSVIMYIKTLE
ncbi:MAG: hypothetical protein KDK30_13505, partial [Leptospiraceae bacterium]|nr:hypothetical protein [Leptospiraceae bacterium]